PASNTAETHLEMGRPLCREFFIDSPRQTQVEITDYNIIGYTPIKIQGCLSFPSPSSPKILVTRRI
ncbi:MAG: hypothetical protein CVU58_06805, partial [Deltaproteobacteria bacterium HGW-Deltaproteobacteria-16]